MAAATAAYIVSAVLAANSAYQGKRQGEKAKRAADTLEATPVVDTEAQREAAKRRSILARSKASGFGTPSTFQTGPGGIPAPPSAGKGTKTLLGQ